MHDASEPVVIINRIVLGTAIVPEGKGTLSPAKTRGELRLDLGFEELDEQRPALLFRPAREAHRVTPADTAGYADGKAGHTEQAGQFTIQ